MELTKEGKQIAPVSSDHCLFAVELWCMSTKQTHASLKEEKINAVEEHNPQR
jgi:hypothetical protein